MAVLLKLLRAKWNPESIPSTSFAGKTVIVTGSNVGLGLEAARHFYRLDCSRLILAVRTVSKGEAAQRDIEKNTIRSTPHEGVIQVWHLDMSSFSSVQSFGDRVNKELDRLDVALLNAGVFEKYWKQSPEGWEETLQVNVLSTALLACLLLPKLKASRRGEAIPHLGIVSSGTHIISSFPKQSASNILAELNNPSAFTKQYYAISKLFVMYIVSQISQRTLPSSSELDVIITSTCPGLCKSDLTRDFDGWYHYLVIAFSYSILAKNTEEGSRSLVHSVCLGPESHGGYWKNGEITKPGPLVGTEEGKKLEVKVWAEIGEVLKEKVPAVTEWFS